MIDHNLDEILTATGLVKSLDALPSDSISEIYRWAQMHHRDFYRLFRILSEDVIFFYCFAPEVSFSLRAAYCKMVLNKKSALKCMFSQAGERLQESRVNLLEFYIKLKKASITQYHGLPSTKFMDMYMDMTGR